MGTVAAHGIPGMRAPEPSNTSEPPGVVVRQAILHLVGSRLLLSDRPVSWSGDVGDFRGYLCSHIAGALGDPQLRAAVARPGGPRTAVAIGDALARGGTGLVEASRDLATLLHDAIGGDRRVKEGVLAVATCDRGADRRPFAALLKLDLGAAFQKEWHDDGYLAVRPLSDTLPAAGERLQKAAFVSADDPAGTRHLLVLDRQVAGLPARFFLEGSCAPTCGSTRPPSPAASTRRCTRRGAP